jgi:hypothetical protein
MKATVVSTMWSANRRAAPVDAVAGWPSLELPSGILERPPRFGKHRDEMLDRILADQPIEKMLRLDRSVGSEFRSHGWSTAQRD